MKDAGLVRTCTRCLEPRPTDEFSGRNRKCRDCMAALKKNWRDDRVAKGLPAEPEPKGYGRPGRQPKVLLPVPGETVEPEETDLTDKKNAPRFDDRHSLESYLKNEMSGTFGEYDAIIASAKRMMIRAEAAGEIGEVVKQQNAIRSAIRDKQAMMAGLTKQFELLAGLDRPLDEDPKFTPVVLVLNLDPPSHAYVPKPHYLNPDDIQEGQDIE